MMLNWQNTAWEFKEQPPQVAILPLASLEPHGWHLPVGADQFIVSEIAIRVAVDLPFSNFLLPTWPFGTPMVDSEKAGVISVGFETLWAVVRDIVLSLYEHNIRYVVVINNHGSPAASTAIPVGNSIVKTAVRQLNYETPGLTAIWVQPFAAGREALAALFSSTGLDVDNIESAILAHLAPARVPGREDEGPLGTYSSQGKLALDVVVQATIAYIERSFTLIDQLKHPAGFTSRSN
jgi:creatinine amidohydrolase/Fe(II)-dependent formamide hydrolase-like protein